MPKSKPPRNGKAKNNQQQTHTKESKLNSHLVSARVSCENAMRRVAALSMRLVDIRLVNAGNSAEINSLCILFSKDVIEHRARLERIHSQQTRPFRDNNENDMFKAASIVQQYMEWIESYEAVIEPSMLRLGVLLTEAEENLKIKSKSEVL